MGLGASKGEVGVVVVVLVAVAVEIDVVMCGIALGNFCERRGGCRWLYISQ